MSDSRPPKASVLVPVRNEERHIREAVAAMQAQRFEGDVELIFVDGRSDDRTRDILEELAAEDPAIKVLDNPHRVTPHALNIALAAARGDFIARMDAHAFYPPDYLSRGAERLRRGDVTWVSGPQVPEGVGPWSRRVALAVGSWLGSGSSRRWAGEQDECAPAEWELDTGVFTGMWRRSTLEALGGWDEGWPINQDSEMAARVLKEGGRIVCLAEMGARYVPRDRLSSLGRQYWRWGMYRAKTGLRHPRSLRPANFLNPGIALALTGSIVAPRRLARICRLAVCAYAAVVFTTSARLASSARAEDALALPAVFAAMHVPYGFGFLAGLARFAPGALHPRRLHVRRSEHA